MLSLSLRMWDSIENETFLPDCDRWTVSHEKGPGSMRLFHTGIAAQAGANALEKLVIVHF